MRNGKDNAANERAVVASSGNVFGDLGFPNAGEELAKAQLASRIVDVIEQSGLTQAQAADILGIDQPKVSALARGRLEGFSTDRLFRFLNALGDDIEIRIRPKAAEGGRGGIHVVPARQ